MSDVCVDGCAQCCVYAQRYTNFLLSRRWNGATFSETRTRPNAKRSQSEKKMPKQLSRAQRIFVFFGDPLNSLDVDVYKATNWKATQATKRHSANEESQRCVHFSLQPQQQQPQPLSNSCCQSLATYLWASILKHNIDIIIWMNGRWHSPITPYR